MKPPISTLCLTVSLTALTVTASLPAQAFGVNTAEQRSACMGDAFRLCGSDIPFVSRIEACMIRKLDELSPGCRAEFRAQGRTQLRSRHFSQY
jgi:hypothetical protein